MPKAVPLPNEAERLKALRSLHILDTPPDPVFDELTRQAAAICETPVALVSIVEEGRQWFKSRVGLAACETPLEESICAHALRTPDRPLIIPDTLKDARSADNPAVTKENGIRFYAGIPLRTPDGHALGSLCVIDYKPRHLSNEQIDKLRALAQRVSVNLSLLRRAPAERKLAIGFGSAFALLLCMASYFTLQATRFLESDQWVAHTNLVIRTVERTLFDVQAAESYQRGYSASGQAAFLPLYSNAVTSLRGRMAGLREAILDDPMQVDRYDRLKTAVDARLAVMDERIEQRRTLGLEALGPTYFNGRGRSTMEIVVSTGQKMIKAENNLMHRRVDTRAYGLHVAMGMLLGTSVLGACLLIAGFWLTRRELRRSHALGGALAHSNLGLEGEIAERRRAQQRLSVQHSVARVAAENVSFAKAAPDFIKSICEQLDWELGELWTADASAGVLRLASHWPRPTDCSVKTDGMAKFAAFNQARTFAKGEGLPGRVWSEGIQLWEHDLAASECGAFTAPEQAVGLGRAFAFPLQAAGEKGEAGVMVFFSRERGAPDPELAATMDTVAGQIAQFAARCEAQAGLQASQTRFTAFIENAPAIAYIKDANGRMIYGNETLLRTFGLQADEWIGKTDADFWPEATPALRENDLLVLAGESAVEMKETVPLPDGNLSHWLSYKFPLCDEPTGRKLLAGISFDITAREKAESALRVEREFLGALLNNLQAGVVACDADGNVTQCNRAATLFYGFNPERAIPPFARWGEYFDTLTGNGTLPMSEEINPFARALQGEVTRDEEYIIRPKNGPERALSLNVTPFDDGQGHLLGAVAVIHDVTARRQAQEDALHSLREKETLLQEVHHRVKNNLQIIGSLLSMQARRTKSPVALAALAESASRVRSIALVHEKLYRAVDLEFVDAADYLRTVARNLMDALGAERLRLKGRVSLEFDLEEGHQFDASLAIACGLILNEALTNSFKHGFPDERSGQVVVALHGLGDAAEHFGGPNDQPTADKSGDAAASWLRLEVRDNGVGLSASALTPAGTAELARNSLGLRLVRDLTKQVAGRLEFLPADAATGTGLALRLDFAVQASAAIA